LGERKFKMSKAAAKHRKKAARHENGVRHAKRAGHGGTSRRAKPVTSKEQVVGITGEQQLGFEPGVGDQSNGAPAAYAEPSMDAVEVMEIEVVSGPDDSLGADEAEFSLVPEDGFPEDEE
jgi:hypothetical protein